VTRKASLAAVVVSAACFATLGPLQTWAFARGAESLSLLAVRFALAAVVMAAAQAIRDPSALRVTRSDLVRFLGLSLSGYGAGSLCYSFALREVGVSVTTVLLYTYPAMVSIIGWLFLKERFPPRRLAAVALTFAGCALVAGVLSSGVRLGLRGLLLGLGAGLGYAVFNVLSFRTLGRTPRLVLMAYTFGFSAIGMAVIAAFTGSAAAVTRWQPQAWMALSAIVAVPTFAAVMLYLGGMRALGAPQAAIVSTLELPLAVMLAAALSLYEPLRLAVGLTSTEHLSPVQLIGAVVVLAGVVLAEWGSGGVEVDGVPTV
jgi:drug/metabolite transporter (DMT)-like permease